MATYYCLHSVHISYVTRLPALPWVYAELADEETGLSEKQPGVSVVPGANCGLGSPVFSPQEPVMTCSRTQKGERAPRLWRSTSFLTLRTLTQTRTWTKMKKRMRRRVRMSCLGHPQRHPRPGHQPHFGKTPLLFGALSPQMPPLTMRPHEAARSQKPST
jgi:hypothetical protein